jgi:predicted metalloprotease
MRWQRGHQSPDIIDRRGAGGAGLPVGAMTGVLSLVGRRFGIKGVLVALVIIALIAGYGMLGGGESARVSDRGQQGAGERASDERVQFVGFVLDDAQAVWRKQFAERGGAYENAKLVLFTDRTSTGCGFGSAATGPFYCPSDSRVYLDLGFFQELQRQLGAPGDFAQAYVIAHELGHHVQNLLGTSDRVHRAAQRDRQGADSLSVRLELQADCYAGIWGHSTQRRDLLEQGDIDEALRATAAIGDDRLQRQATGTVQPEKWTHGSSEQRSRWFRRGLEQGSIDACDTFAASTL